MMGGYGMGFGGGLFGLIYMLLPLLIIGLIIYFAVKLGVRGTSNYGTQRESYDPVHIAEERYAKGEISAEELQEIRRNLKKS